jgi:hypothetical protein
MSLKRVLMGGFLIGLAVLSWCVLLAIAGWLVSRLLA